MSDCANDEATAQRQDLGATSTQQRYGHDRPQRRRLAWVVMAGLAVIVISALPAPAGEVTGEWLRDDGSARLEIAPCGAALCGTLVWLREPRADIHNPDATLRARSLLGLTILTEIAPSARSGQWEAKVYNPEDGKTYSGKAILRNDAKLDLQGCVLGGLICKGARWMRPN